MCIAVGSYMDTNGREFPLVEGFDGVEWRIDPIRIPKQWDATLYAVSCVSVSACTAVGSYDNADGDTLGLAARWNGRSWNRQAVPLPSTTSGMTLLGITCRSRTTCTAVGSPDDSTGEPPVVEHWNGRRWLAQRVEKPGDAFGGYLADVACASNGQCVAVGGFLSSSTECWVPWVQQEVAGRWTVRRSPAFGDCESESNGRTGVSCTAATRCTAVGYDDTGEGTVGVGSPVVERLGGGAWRRQRTPDLTYRDDPWGGGGWLQAVSAPRRSRVWPSEVRIRRSSPVRSPSAGPAAAGQSTRWRARRSREASLASRVSRHRAVRPSAIRARAALTRTRH
jgi:hypothetical protein